MTAVGRWYRRHVWTATLLLILLVVAVGFAVLQVSARGRIVDGIRVAGIDLGGQTRAAAQDVLSARLVPAVATVTLDVGRKQPLTLTLAQLGVRVDVGASADAAYDAGRWRSPAAISVWIPGRGDDVKPVVRVDAAKLRRGVEAVREAVDVDPRNARLTITDGKVTVVPARDGSEVDVVALARLVVADVKTGQAYSGPVPMKTVAPDVSTAEAQSRAEAAAAYFVAPLTLRYRTHTVVLAPSAIADMLSVNTGDDADEYPLTFDNGRARVRLHELFAFAEREPIDARIIVQPEGGITVTDSQDGVELDMDVLLEDMDDAVAGGGGLRTVFVALRSAPPSLTADEARSLGFANLGSQFTTYFDTRNTARATNIAVAAKLVDGSVVKPGEVFSLNAAIGPRTVNRGFDYAPVIAADDVLRQGVGGGVCQYATTLFNAVFFAGLPVVERHAHTFYIAHYPVGRDATVAWGALDFRFRNDTGKTLLIRSWTDNGALTVAIVGKTGRSVSYSTGEFTDVRKPEHGKSNPRVIYDSDLGAGVIRWEKGVDGRSVRVLRTVRDASGDVLFRDTFVSRYEPMDWIKRVGT